jgi:hypothetical protein
MNEKLNEAAAEVTKWQSTVWSINEKIATAETTLAASEARRRESALMASLGDADAQKNLDEVLQDDIRAVRDLENLRLARPAAEAKLKEAEAAHRAIEVDVRKSQVNKLALERIEAAKEVDQALADAAKALQRYQELGEELFSLTADPRRMSLGDEVRGWSRVARSLPAPFVTLQKMLPGVFFGGGGSLAAAESAHWGVAVLVRKDAA